MCSYVKVAEFGTVQVIIEKSESQSMDYKYVRLNLIFILFRVVGIVTSHSNSGSQYTMLVVISAADFYCPSS